MAFLCSSLPSSCSIAIFNESNTDGSRSCLLNLSWRFRFRPFAASHVCAPAIDKSTFVISETVSENELWAAACLRVRTFNEINPSSYNIQDHRRYLAEREFGALKERISGKREGFTLVSCINATLPLSQLSNSSEDLCSACKFSDGVEDRVVVGSLDLNQCRWLPDEIAGTKPEGIGVDFARAYLSNVCVAKELHRKGVGYKLIDKSKRVAGEWGITDLYVHVTVDNEAAKRLYMKSGFEKESAEPAWQARYLNRPQRLLLWLALPTSSIMSINIKQRQKCFENMKGLEMVVTSFSSPPPIFFFPGVDTQLSSSNGRFAIPSPCLVKGLRRHQDAKLVGNRARGGVVRVLAKPNVPPPPPGKAKVKKEVIMVDPLEAKRLAGKQMEEIKGREKQQRRREIEAINGAWAIIGLTIGLVIEAQTGKGIVAQLAGYWSAAVHLFIPST